MKTTTSDTVRHFAQAHARALIDETMSILQILQWVEAMRGDRGHLACAVYVLELLNELEHPRYTIAFPRIRRVILPQVLGELNEMIGSLLDSR